GLLLRGPRRRHRVVCVRGLVVEADVAPDVEGGAKLRAPFGGGAEYLRAFVDVVAALVSGLHHDLERHAVGGCSGGNAHGVADGATSELEHAVLTEIVEELVHLAGVDAPGRDRHDAWHGNPVLVKIDAVCGV